jgi:hypothetical protein
MNDEDQGGLTNWESKQDHARITTSKKVLRAFHAKCLEYAKERNVTYLDPNDLTQLLGGPKVVKPNFVVEVMNTLLSQVRITLLCSTLVINSHRI